MSKLGVYIPTCRNPVHLRTAVLQVLAQTRKPDVLLVFQNNSDKPYDWSISDLHKMAFDSGVYLDYQFHTGALKVPDWYRISVDRLLNHWKCNLFCKLDDDDIVYRAHLRTLENYMDGKSYVVGRRADLLVLRTDGTLKHKEGVDFGRWNPTGGQPNSTMYTAAVASEWIREMTANPGVPDDLIFARHIMNRFAGTVVDIPATTCYVAHGRNVSTAGWVDNLPEGVFV